MTRGLRIQLGMNFNRSLTLNECLYSQQIERDVGALKYGIVVEQQMHTEKSLLMLLS